MPEFLQPLWALVTQHKFWSLLVVALAASGVAWAADLGQWTPLIILVLTTLGGGAAVKVQERRAANAPDELGTPGGAEVE